jgi:hypothetical protein
MEKEHIRIIPFFPDLARQLGDIPSAIFYAQLWYWKDKGKRSDGYIYKTKKEIQEETTLTRDQQDRIRVRLVEKGWLATKVCRANAHATLHYKCLRQLEGAKHHIRLGRTTLPGTWDSREL